ncbi:MAG TPA: GMC family oxidoreductase N-terminal domain-containing protein [Vicinamibacterales bacterium]|nr:GMC family oxidoreductase N-terminal domain-containing protein [Vicinamibacterales bacterium]
MTILSPLERQTLSAFCDTLVPRLGADAGEDPRLMALSAEDVGLAKLVEDALAAVTDADQQSELRLFLGLLEGRAFNGLIGGHWQPFSRLPLEARTKILFTLAKHPIPPLRKGFSGIARLALSTFYSAQPATEPNRSHASFNYSVPPRPHTSSSQPIALLDVGAAAQLSCDVLIVGSGAGGGVAAAELTAAGHDVLVVEKGQYFPDARFDGRELDAREHLYERRGALATADGGIVILAGSTLGGGTTINWGGALRPPAQLLQDWEREFGFAGAAGAGFQRSLDAVSARISVDETRPDDPSVNTRVFEAGLNALGYNVTRIPRNVKSCGSDCGFCLFGCPAGSKQSTVKTYLQDALACGARIVTGAEVDRVLHQRGAVTGAVVRVTDSRGVRQVTVNCKAVVLAAGAIHTPAVLLRSGLANRNIGRHLHLHPTTGTSGLFKEPIRAWQGAPMTRLSAQFADLDAKGYGVRLMNAPAHPGTLAFATPWLSGRRHKQVMQESEHTANILVVTRDRQAGRVTLSAAGAPRVEYSMSRQDAGHMLTGIKEAMRVHVAAGAVSVHSPQSTRPMFRPARDGAFDRFLDGVGRHGVRVHDVAMFSAHQMSSARIAHSPSLGVADPGGQTFEVKRLFITDGSVLPTCSGVNPMLTILGTAHFLSQQIKAQL